MTILRRPPVKVFVLAIVAIVALTAYAYNVLTTRSPLRSLQPVDHTTFPSHVQELNHPTFSDIRQYERTLPQQVLPAFWTKARPKYLSFPWEAWGTGWNNVFQEQLLNTHLAYLTNRGYVFVDYIARDHPPFPDTLPNGTRHQLHIPMNAFTSGPTGGGPLSLDHVNLAAPRAISQEWWNVVCPEEEIVDVWTNSTIELGLDQNSSGEEILQKWADKLLKIEEPCVRILGGSVFDYLFIGSEKVVSLWPSYGPSPTLKAFAWSALVTRALERNFALFSSEALPASLSRVPSAWRITTSTTGDFTDPHPLTLFRPYHTSEPPIKGLLGLHVRRGDYEEHCAHLANLNYDYNAWNLLGRPDLRTSSAFPALPDRLTVPAGSSQHDVTFAHCWPTAEVLVERVRAVRAAAESGETFPAQTLRAVFIATNGDHEWLAALVTQLRADGWESVTTSFDLQLAKDEQAVAQAVDMGVLTSAETFIGNGFSSLTSNVVQLRLAGKKHPDTNRFW